MNNDYQDGYNNGRRDEKNESVTSLIVWFVIAVAFLFAVFKR